MVPTHSSTKNLMTEAHDAPRCQHIKLSGTRCGAPALQGRRLCYFHTQARKPNKPDYRLPEFIEDSSSLQFAVMQVMRALQDKAYDHKACGLLLYSLQIASSNLRGLAAEHAQLQPATAQPETPAARPSRPVRPAAEPSSPEKGPGLAELLLGLLANPKGADGNAPPRIRSREDYYALKEKAEQREREAAAAECETP